MRRLTEHDLKAAQPGKWLVHRESDNRLLCVDGKWRGIVSHPRRIKLYTHLGRARRYGLKGGLGTCVCVYPGDTLDVCGNVSRGKRGHSAPVSQVDFVMDNSQIII